MADKYLDALTEANSAWANSLYMSREERVTLAQDLHTYGLFSLNQLGKIVRLSATAVSDHCKKENTTGGRFRAEAASVLMHMRRSYLETGKLNANLVRAAVDAGCSASSIARLTGINYPSVYYANKKGRK